MMYVKSSQRIAADVLIELIDHHARYSSRLKDLTLDTQIIVMKELGRIREQLTMISAELPAPYDGTEERRS